MTAVYRQCPFRGQAFFCRQLQFLVTLDVVLVWSVHCEDLRISLLWLSMICLVLFIQL